MIGSFRPTSAPEERVRPCYKARSVNWAAGDLLIGRLGLGAGTRRLEALIQSNPHNDDGGEAPMEGVHDQEPARL
jgi:hypothetical protein